jgi:isopentenyl diphosphate isomerase/L-lactate dehydrogenase-like FMN-dependent dehydrogenase
MRFNSVQQAQDLARRRVPRSVYRFIEGGTDAERTVAANRSAFGDVTFLPRAGVVHPAPSLTTKILGLDLAMPVMLAPATSGSPTAMERSAPHERPGARASRPA